MGNFFGKVKKNFENKGGNLKQGENAAWPQRGMNAPVHAHASMRTSRQAECISFVSLFVVHHVNDYYTNTRARTHTQASTAYCALQ